MWPDFDKHALDPLCDGGENLAPQRADKQSHRHRRVRPKRSGELVGLVPEALHGLQNRVAPPQG